MPAAIEFTRPGSKIGVSVPGSLGPLGNIPTHRRLPASTPRNHFSPDDASETPGASGFGEPNRTRCRMTTMLAATIAGPAAVANVASGWFLIEPKNVIA